jgi:oligopeptide/dipeptide ABC transporter ATP-binding protein
MTSGDGFPVLSVESLSIDIGASHILNDVTFSVSRGRSFALVGETGSGKTMTARACVGLLGRVGARVVNGRVALGRHDVTEGSRRTWRHLRGHAVALVPQSSMSSLDPLMTVEKQLLETVRVLDPQSDARARVRALLTDVQLEPTDRVLSSFPHQLSGGMRQRVMIALALAGSPDLVVADEPTTALDVTVQRGILELLDRLRIERGMSIVLISHDLAVVQTIADTIGVMYAGSLVEVGPTKDILRSPVHPYTRALIKADPTMAVPGQPLHAINGAPPRIDERGPGCACHLERPELVAIAEGRFAACPISGG